MENWINIGVVYTCKSKGSYISSFMKKKLEMHVLPSYAR